MSRAKRNRKAKMVRRQAKRAEQFEKRLDAAHAHFVDARERARLRIEIIDKLDAPEPVKNVLSALVDPVGFAHDMIARQVRRGDTGG